MLFKYIFGDSASFIQKCEVVLTPMKLGPRKVKLVYMQEILYA